MAGDVRHEELVQWLTRSQGWLYGYILNLLPDMEAAKDVLQQTNLILWRRADEFDPGRSFLGWASQIARYEVLSYLRDRKRDRHQFHDALIQELAAAADSAGDDDPDARAMALRQCLTKLAPKDRDLVLARYSPNASVQSMAVELRKTVNAVSRSLHRIRNLLGICIEKALLADET